MKDKIHLLKEHLPFSKKKELSPKQQKIIQFLNRYSLIFHVLLSCDLVFLVELISRRNLFSAFDFINKHTFAFFYNSLIVFASLTLVYLFKRRTFMRVIISSFWLLLGIVNGCILSNRVTPFGYTDLKCINDLLSMTNTSYFTAAQATIVVIGLLLFLAACVVLFIKGPKFPGKRHMVMVPLSIMALIFIGIPVTTHAAQDSHLIASYFSNIAQGYENNGFIYGFSSSVVDRGMSKPSSYNQQTISDIQTRVRNSGTAAAAPGKKPNVILILLESFCDPDEIKFLKYNEDPVPTFHNLEKNFSTGYVTMPVVGAGTANSEFEVLTGMSIQYFGTGEYPYKTILKQTDCESIASDLSSIGYGTHAVHNNGGNFYSRVNAFSMMGFDSFTSKELMGVRELTPDGSWSTDNILVDETIKTLDKTPNQPDFTYTITVGSHGAYPKEPVIDHPAYTVSGVDDPGMTNSWTYYINQLHQVDTFLNHLIKRLEQRNEDTVLVAFGDHLPTMGLKDSDMRSHNIYKTNYVTWNNCGLTKQDTDLYAYQLMAKITDSVGIHEGTMMNFHQTQMHQPEYDAQMENLQYDILYGKRYCYNGQDRYPATEIVMGVDDVTIDYLNPAGNTLYINGDHFTAWSHVYVNGNKVDTNYINQKLLSISLDDIDDGDSIMVSQVGSSDTIFRSSNEVLYQAPNSTESTESTELPALQAPIPLQSEPSDPLSH